MTTHPSEKQSRFDPEPLPRRDFLGLAALGSMAAAFALSIFGMLKLPKAAVSASPAKKFNVTLPDTLAAGEEKSYTITSHGARPVIAVVDPTDQSDVALDILDADGTLLTTANYSGPGGVETAYVLPLGQTAYTVRIREANGDAAAFQILVITLE